MHTTTYHTGLADSADGAAQSCGQAGAAVSLGFGPGPGDKVGPLSPHRGKGQAPALPLEAPSLLTSHLLCLPGLRCSLWVLDGLEPLPLASLNSPVCGHSEGLSWANHLCLCFSLLLAWLP